MIHHTNNKRRDHHHRHNSQQHPIWKKFLYRLIICIIISFIGQILLYIHIVSSDHHHHHHHHHHHNNDNNNPNRFLSLLSLTELIQQQKWIDGYTTSSFLLYLFGQATNKNSDITAINDNNNKNENNNIAYRGKLDCTPYGGPTNDIAKEMIYWKYIPSDYNNDHYKSPYYNPNRHEQYLTFEVDEGGWNNKRMAFETVIAMAIAMGRTLVLPPRQHFDIKFDIDNTNTSYQKYLSFEDYYDLKNMKNLKIISFTEFLKTYVMSGKLINPITGLPSYPPMQNRTNWENSTIYSYYDTKQCNGHDGKILYDWLRNVSYILQWDRNKCVATFPSKPNNTKSILYLENKLNEILLEDQIKYNNNTTIKKSKIWLQRVNEYINHSTPVNSSVKERLRQVLANRRQLCIYNTTLQNIPIIHIVGTTKYRLLIHFYSFILIENYKYDLYIKRLIRDQLKYHTIYHCIAAQLIHQIRQTSIANSNNNNDTSYDAFHIRRNDFQHFMKQQHDEYLNQYDIYYNNTSHMISDNRTVYISTDANMNDKFFRIFHQHYHTTFFHNYTNIIEQSTIKPNFYDIIEELIASKSTTFIGTYYSTFTNYINRLRGYHNTMKFKKDDHNDGSINSYYIASDIKKERRTIMKLNYTAIQPWYWIREYPIGWHDLDHEFIIKDEEYVAI